MEEQNVNISPREWATENSSEEVETGVQTIDEEKPSSALRAQWLRFLRPRDPSGLKSGDDPGPPPDGGLKAWTQVAMAHLIIFNTWGFVNSFGVFQTYYTGALGRSSSDISWIGSVQIFLLYAIGTLSGHALDAGLFRPVCVAGCFLHVLGIFMTSISTRYWQVLLAQGVCVGIGNGLLFCPTISLVATYFSSKQALAMGIAAAGSTSGSLVYPVVVQQLLPSIGFGWTVRVLGFITLSTSILATAFLTPRLPPRASGSLVEWSAFTEPSYVLYSIGMFLNFMGVYFAFYYIGAYARDITGLSYKESINLILILNGVGYVGRVMPNILADKFVGALNATIPCVLGSGIMLFAWTGIHDQAGQIVFAVLYGLFASGVQSMFTVALSALTNDLSKVGTRNGMCFTVISVAALTGPPIAGVLVQAGENGYLYAQVWGGCIVVAGGLVLVAARICETGWHLRVHV